MEVFVKRLRELLEDRDIRQKDIAKRVGVSEVTISRYLSGDRKPRTDVVVNLARELNVTADYLLGRTDNPDGEDEIHTIAAHHDGDEFTERELEEIEWFKRLVLDRRKKKD